MRIKVWSRRNSQSPTSNSSFARFLPWSWAESKTWADIVEQQEPRGQAPSPASTSDINTLWDILMYQISWYWIILICVLVFWVWWCKFSIKKKPLEVSSNATEARCCHGNFAFWNAHLRIPIQSEVNHRFLFRLKEPSFPDIWLLLGMWRVLWSTSGQHLLAGTTALCCCPLPKCHNSLDGHVLDCC